MGMYCRDSSMKGKEASSYSAVVSECSKIKNNNNR